MSDHRSRVLQALLSVTVAAAALTGCASSSPTTPSSSATSPAAESTTATSKSTAGSSSADASTTLIGTVQEGVESGCVVLVGADGKVLANLLGLDTVAAPVGSEVEVTGKFETDMMTTCQQGEPFTVTAVELG